MNDPVNGLWLDGKTEKLAELIREFLQNKSFSDPVPGSRPAAPPLRLLVVGCGSGLEALILARSLQAAVTGIDYRPGFSGLTRGKEAEVFRSALEECDVHLQQGDATELGFAADSFDLVYSYHVLEHIPHYRQALKEMHRVLRTGGAYLVGTPNRSRLLGYLGSKDIKSWRRKLYLNGRDWLQRLQGRFRNEYGAHAGFTGRELKTELLAVFRHVRDITPRYYRLIYPQLAGWLRMLNRSGLAEYIYPAIYFWGYKLDNKSFSV